MSPLLQDTTQTWVREKIKLQVSCQSGEWEIDCCSPECLCPLVGTLSLWANTSTFPSLIPVPHSKSSKQRPGQALRAPSGILPVIGRPWRASRYWDPDLVKPRPALLLTSESARSSWCFQKNIDYEPHSLFCLHLMMDDI